MVNTRDASKDLFSTMTQYLGLCIKLTRMQQESRPGKHHLRPFLCVHPVVHPFHLLVPCLLQEACRHLSPCPYPCPFCSCCASLASPRVPGRLRRYNMKPKKCSESGQTGSGSQDLAASVQHAIQCSTLAHQSTPCPQTGNVGNDRGDLFTSGLKNEHGGKSEHCLILALPLSRIGGKAPSTPFAAPRCLHRVQTTSCLSFMRFIRRSASGSPNDGSRPARRWNRTTSVRVWLLQHPVPTSSHRRHM